jgi:uncharacterized secreted repeat protein (TIGR03808 family)
LLSSALILKDRAAMTIKRRMFLLTGLGLGAAASAARAAPKMTSTQKLNGRSGGDQTAALQVAIDEAAGQGIPLELPAGTFQTGTLRLREGSVVSGARGLTTLRFIGTERFIVASAARGVQVANLTLDGGMRPVTGGLLALESCADVRIEGVRVVNSSHDGIALTSSTGLVAGCSISNVANAALFALNSTMTIEGNSITGCGNNGVLIWSSSVAEDGSQVLNNRIQGIRADAGGTGQNGNGINVFRGGSVTVGGNRITDCAYSAVRGNAASNLAITANHCQRIGEVALYAEFGFTGVLIANNIVEGAASGVSVTNFNEGGRLAVVQGNLIRNLVRREREPRDKRGEGIAVEADALVTGNTIENAATCGILIGWGQHMRDVSATGNLIRGCRIGILISSDAAAGSALVAQNLISGASDGAIRAHDRGRAFGPDLAKSAATIGRVTISGNSASS